MISNTKLFDDIRQIFKYAQALVTTKSSILKLLFYSLSMKWIQL